MTPSAHTAHVAPVAPTAGAVLAVRPAPTATLHDGFWAARQRTNARVSLDRAWGFLHTSGALPNFVAAAAGEPVAHRGEQNQDAEVYKWVEAASYEVARSGDPTLADRLREACATIVAAQEPDGYLHTWYQLNPARPRLGGLTDGGPDETYTTGHLVQAAVAHHRATGERALLEAASRMVGWLDRTLFAVDPTAVTGHPGLETALVELYRETGDGHVLELAAHLVSVRGHGVLGEHRFGSSHYQDYLPLDELPTLTGHAVAGLYLMCGATDVAVETGDTALLGHVERLWQRTVATKAYLTGGLGSRPRNEDFGDDYELSPDSAYCETCAAVAMVMWSWRLLLATGRSRYADAIERTAFNAVLVGVSLDGTAFRYDNPLQVRAAHRTPAAERALPRSAWFELACCPPNVMRLLASWGHYQATVAADGLLRIEQLTGCAVAWDDDGRFEVRTDYPADGRVDVTWRGGTLDQVVAVRVPAWVRRVTVDERPVTPADGYVTVDRRWTDGDTVTVRLELLPRLTAAHPRVDAARGCLAVEYGPLVYCVERADADDLRLRPDVGGIQVRRDPRHWVELDLPTVRADVSGWHESLYRDLPDVPATATAAAPARAVPYFAWGNEGAGPMRVWLPTDPCG